MLEIIERAATFSPDRVHRYDLYRRLRLANPVAGAVAFVLLNPSTANETKEDPTVRRCLGFAARWRFAHVRILNIFALRSTDPAALYAHPDPIGPKNDEFLLRWCSTTVADRVVIAWGAHGALRARGTRVTQLVGALRGGLGVFEFGATKGGQPMHPLYLPADRVLVPARILRSEERPSWAASPASMEAR